MVIVTAQTTTITTSKRIGMQITVVGSCYRFMTTVLVLFPGSLSFNGTSLGRKVS